jgi:hypothetical protein
VIDISLGVTDISHHCENSSVDKIDLGLQRKGSLYYMH